MGKTGRHPQLAVVVGRQQRAHPAAELRRAAAQVYRHIKHLALGYSHQLALRVLNLVMQAAQYAAS